MSTRKADAGTSPTAGVPKSIASRLVDLALESGLELWHTPDGDGYCSIDVRGHQEHYSLNSRQFRQFLARSYFQVTKGATANAAAVQTAIGTLSGIARFDSKEHRLHLRTAEHGGAYYLDLGDPGWTAIEVDQYGWRMVTNPPARFRRTRAMGSLPVPVKGGSLEELRELLNVGSTDDFTLAVTWLVQALRPVGPYPVLVLMGEQGSAKSTTSKLLRRLVDPNYSDLRSEPRDARDLAVAAENGHVIAFDNLSKLTDWLSDALCRLATGGGFSTRTLYENREEELFVAQRPVILNGIAQVAIRPDLVDRSIVLNLPVIDDGRRQQEADFWASFNAAAPRILGALLDAMVAGLSNFRRVHLEALPRMADFATWAVAAEPALPWASGTFLSAFDTTRRGAIESALDGDFVADLLLAIAPWNGTATELLKRLNVTTPGVITQRRDWYSSPRQVADHVRRLVPALRRIGIEVAFARQPRTGGRLISVKNAATTASSPSSPHGEVAASVSVHRGLESHAQRREALPPLLDRPNEKAIGRAGDGDNDGAGERRGAHERHGHVHHDDHRDDGGHGNRGGDGDEGDEVTPRLSDSHLMPPVRRDVNGASVFPPQAGAPKHRPPQSVFNFDRDVDGEA